MKFTFNLSPHELMPVAAMRCLAIVECLGRSASANSALTLQKAAIFDAALKNPNIARRLLSELVPDKILITEIPNVLYPDEIDYGFATSTKDITTIASLLCQADLISIEMSGGAPTLKPKGEDALIDVERLPSYWRSTLKALKPILSKSANTLQQAVIRESKNHAEQHVFIVGTAGPQGGNEELRGHI